VSSSSGLAFALTLAALAFAFSFTTLARNLMPVCVGLTLLVLIADVDVDADANSHAESVHWVTHLGKSESHISISLLIALISLILSKSFKAEVKRMLQMTFKWQQNVKLC